jgi:hypothetical protein
MKITGIVLILIGFVAILFGGFSNTGHSQVPDMGLVQVDDTENHPLGIPPILAFAATAAGGAMDYKSREPAS